MLAQYKRWMNLRLYACAALLDDQQRRQDRGAFFKSIHGTFKQAGTLLKQAGIDPGDTDIVAMPGIQSP